MNSFWRIFWLEWIGLLRSRTLVMLAFAAVAWVLVAPHVLTGDGTIEGAHVISVRYALGGAFLLVLVTLLAGVTGALARERAAKRLQLTMVRPVPLTYIALGKLLAHVAAGALVMALAFGALFTRVDATRACSHVYSPVLPTPVEEARTMYDAYMNDPETPDEIKRAKKSVVLRMLAQRAVDHYQTIPTNCLTSWRFAPCEPRAVRIRFTNQLEMRQDVRGCFAYAGLSGAVSNITQAIVEIPLAAGRAAVQPEADHLTFANLGKSALMIRPRKDIQLLVGADGFGANAVRAYLELMAILALVLAFGLFLSAGLGRPVALFTAIVMLIISEMSPSVVEQYPDELESKLVDRVGLVITRCAVEMTRPLTALDPLTRLSEDTCIEWREVARTLLADAAAVPIVLVLLAALVMPRKQEAV